MKSKFLVFFVMSSASLVEAYPLRNLNSIGLEYRDQTLSSRNPDENRPDKVNVLNAKSDFFWEQSKLTWQSELAASTGRSSGSSFTNLLAQSSLNLRDTHSSDSLEANWTRTHGLDVSLQALEPTLTNDGAPFTSTGSTYSHIQVLNAQNDLGLGLSVSRNHGNETTLDSRSYETNWNRTLSRSWLNTLSLRRGIQFSQATNLESSTWNIQESQTWLITPEWTAQILIGALQEHSTQQINTLTMGTAFLYSSNTGGLAEPKQAPIPSQSLSHQLNLDQLENNRSQNQWRWSWLRNSSQLRKGEQKFLADEFTAQGIWIIDLEQTLIIELQSLQSLDKVEAAARGLRQDSANLDYHWRHSIGPTKTRLFGTFGLGLSQDRVQQRPQLTDRQMARINYSISF